MESEIWWNAGMYRDWTASIEYEIVVGIQMYFLNWTRFIIKF